MLAPEVSVVDHALRQGKVWAFYPKCDGKCDMFADGTAVHLRTMKLSAL